MAYNNNENKVYINNDQNAIFEESGANQIPEFSNEDQQHDIFNNPQFLTIVQDPYPPISNSSPDNFDASNSLFSNQITMADCISID